MHKLTAIRSLYDDRGANLLFLLPVENAITDNHCWALTVQILHIRIELCRDELSQHRVHETMKDTCSLIGGGLSLIFIRSKIGKRKIMFSSSP